MDILAKITELRNARNWSEYQLAEKSGLTQSTISSWYRKNMVPSIPSLEKICDAFGISISQFFLEDNDNTVILTETQLQLLKHSSRLTAEQMNALMNFLQTL